tara:strand:+ start:401 stop:1183 length:783 start_codon:yes stop_codon:yes gene_type:complete
MSLYVTDKNQDLLWNVINKNQQITSYFNRSTNENIYEWFKTIIRIFYDKNNNKKLDMTELNKINKETILYMIESTREKENIVTVSSDTTPVMSISTPSIVPDNRSALYTSKFEERQLEYSNMNKKQAPTKPDFTDNIEDGVMTNMDDMIKQQMQQREYDMNAHMSSSNVIPHSEKVDNMSRSNQVSNPVSNPVSNESTDFERYKDDIIELKKQIKIIEETLSNQTLLIGNMQKELMTYQKKETSQEIKNIVNDIIDEIEK